MVHVAISRDALSKWKKTVLEGLWHSTGFAVAILFNALVVLNLIHSLSLPRLITGNNHLLFMVVLFAVGFLGYTGYLMSNAVRLTKAAHLSDRDEHKTAMLSVSYLAFRIYILLLGVLFTVVSTLNYVASR